MFRSIERSGDTIHLFFDHVGSGLTIRVDGAVLKSFTICGANGAFVPAIAAIYGDTVIVKTVK